MQVVRLLVGLVELLVRFLPTFLDTGVQLWNAVEVNRLAVQGNIWYSNPLCCRSQKQNTTDPQSTEPPSTDPTSTDPPSTDPTNTDPPSIDPTNYDQNWTTFLERGQHGNPKVINQHSNCS